MGQTGKVERKKTAKVAKVAKADVAPVLDDKAAAIVKDVRDAVGKVVGAQGKVSDHLLAMVRHVVASATRGKSRAVLLDAMWAGIFEGWKARDPETGRHFSNATTQKSNLKALTDRIGFGAQLTKAAKGTSSFYALCKWGKVATTRTKKAKGKGSTAKGSQADTLANVAKEAAPTNAKIIAGIEADRQAKVKALTDAVQADGEAIGGGRYVDAVVRAILVGAWFADDASKDDAKAA